MALVGTVAPFQLSEYTNSCVLISLRRLRGIHSEENIAEIILDALHGYRVDTIG